MEYNNNNKGSLWLSDNKTVKGDTYYSGSVVINDTKYTLKMFKVDESKKIANPKLPDFNLLVGENKETNEVKEEKDPYQDFANENKKIEVTEMDLPF
jgi:hypothetical protein